MPAQAFPCEGSRMSRVDSLIPILCAYYAWMRRLHCPCDQLFFKCLKNNVAKNNRSSSQMVGYIYFDKLRTQCYALDHPIVGCKEYIKYELSHFVAEKNTRGPFLPLNFPFFSCRKSNRCHTYVFDESQPRVWQWFDVPTFAEGWRNTVFFFYVITFILVFLRLSATNIPTYAEKSPAAKLSRFCFGVNCLKRVPRSTKARGHSLPSKMDARDDTYNSCANE